MQKFYNFIIRIKVFYIFLLHYMFFHDINLMKCRLNVFC